MKLTKSQKRFLESLRALNAAGLVPNVIQVATAAGTIRPGQVSYKYRVYKQLADQGLVGDLGSGRPHAIRITRDGLRAIGEIR